MKCLSTGFAALFLSIFGLAPAAAQDLSIPEVRYPTLPPTGRDAAAFVTEGWKLERTAMGDLNGDKRADIAFVSIMTSPANIIRVVGAIPLDTNPRLLAVAFALPTGGYRLAFQNHRLIPRHDNPSASDWFAEDETEFEIVRGTLRLSLHRFMNAGGWSMGKTKFTFRWQDGSFRLIGFDDHNTQRNTGEVTEVSINYLTGRKVTKNGSISSESTRDRQQTLPRRALLTLDQIGSGLDYWPSDK